ncbi:Oidioi.mRNA.OKI2018_I69.chr1.g2789.t2.cds [Oikopleura dioica]|uniref:Oidioi.mRNA.OKI2018_I69.chr1.g2789.t2.cds n=1 Tax=Oikopleura dioica TaxID=34765 RepID=A0ABN7SS64_OIKDI|nr:Oidioi.mRNA.OKI2018_I69.chr1.g2789.t2.cds [Oikopleura dioica]
MVSHSFCRKKDISQVTGSAGDKISLKKLLTTLDLTSLGVGSCNGTGMYVVAGLIAKELAGPGVVFSFLIAGLASLLSGICYAEFGVRVPKTSGSAYTYSYVTIGECTAFFIGWNLILEYLIGTASGASALSSMLDSLSNRAISKWSLENLGKLHGVWQSPDEVSYPDLVAMGICMVMVMIVGAGLKNSMLLNNLLNAANIVVWAVIMVGGLFTLNAENWNLSPPNGTDASSAEIKKYGDGGFLPYGWEGVMRGAATAFYAYIGFDIIATTGEECKKPHKSIPKAIVSSLVICLVCYISTAMMLTLVDKYWEIDSEAPLTEMFDRCEGDTCHPFMKKAKYLISVGSFCALTASLLGSLFPMPRIIYAMASDGLLFHFLSVIFPPTGTPLIATIIAGLFASVLALVVSLRDLIEMMSIGTLLAYTLVAVSVLVLRYQPTITLDRSLADEDDEEYQQREANRAFDMDDRSVLVEDSRPTPGYGTVVEGEEPPPRKPCFLDPLTDRLAPAIHFGKVTFGLPVETDKPTEETGKIAYKKVIHFVIYTFIYNVFHVVKLPFWMKAVGFLPSTAVLLYLMLKIAQLPPNRTKLPFMVPFVPLLPMSAILANIFLMCRLSTLTWIRFTIWCIIGAVIYFGYGMRFSNLELRAHQPATYKVGLDLDSDFDPNFQTQPKTKKGGYSEFHNEE